MVDHRAELRPGRDFLIALGMSLIAGLAIFSAPGHAFPVLHTILNTGIALGTAAVSLLFWDLGWRTRAAPIRFMAIVFAVTGMLEILHVLAALEPASASDQLNEVLRRLRSGTWAPPAYLLPLGVGAVQWFAPTQRASKAVFALLTLLAAAALFVLFQWLPRYGEPGVLGILRPTLALVPVAWIPVILVFWRRRAGDRIAHALAYYAICLALAHIMMLYSEEATSKFAMGAHFGIFAAGLFLLLSLMQMGTADTARRMRVERELVVSNEALEARVAARTAELEALNTDLRREVGVRHSAEVRALTQLERLELLRRITRAIAERQDLDSIFQVVVRSVEEHLPADFAMLCTREADGGLTVTHVGARSEPLALELAMPTRARIDTDQNGLSRCIAGQQVYEPDVSAVNFPFPQRLAGAGLRSMVIVPLMLESRGGVFAVLVVARRAAAAFSSGESEFLRQLCEHVSLAANQAQLHSSLRRAYEHLQRTQEQALEQERLRALGQLASGIAHDINNAISPVTIYVESLLTYETGFGERARRQLEIIQRAIDDVARTVSRMGEFLRRRPTQQELEPVDLERVAHQVLELTRARWSDMAQQRGVVIRSAVEGPAGIAIAMAVESELREALVNLVLNAIDAMPEGGTLTLRAGRTAHSDALPHRPFVEVVDTGVGMDEETRRRCLEPFFTTKGERGSGLGLAMVYGIAKRHDVVIDIASQRGSGTTVRMTFPAPGAQPGSVTEAPVRKPPTSVRILLIDDDPLLLTSLRDMLVQEGHEVSTANGGRQGLSIFMEALESGRPYLAVITDLGMPHFDGRAVAAAIAKASPRTPVIMLTGWGQRLSATGEQPPEVIAVLDKPPKLSELRETLADCIGEMTEKEAS